MHSLTESRPHSHGEAQTLVHRTFWWELLSTMKSLPEDLTPQVVGVIGVKKVKVC